MQERSSFGCRREPSIYLWDVQAGSSTAILKHPKESVLKDFAKMND